MLKLASFKWEAVSLFNTFTNLHILMCHLFSDYDTHETVTCNSHFIYDLDRQRSLQHFLQIEGLPAKYKVLELPSGN